MSEKIRKFKITGLIKDKEFNALPFGRQVEHWPAIKEFQNNARVGYLSIKRRAFGPAFKEFCDLNKASQYFLEYYDGGGVKDDVVKIYYRN